MSSPASIFTPSVKKHFDFSTIPQSSSHRPDTQQLAAVTPAAAPPSYRLSPRSRKQLDAFTTPVARKLNPVNSAAMTTSAHRQQVGDALVAASSSSSPALPRWMTSATPFESSSTGKTWNFASRSDVGEAVEAALVDDVLFLLDGINGEFVQIVDRRVVVAPRIDAALRESVLRVAPLAVDIADLNALALEHSEYAGGLVRHAFGAALKALCKEFAEFVVQLESMLRMPDSELSLSRLATLLATPARRLSRICAFARDARDWRGAALLNALQRAATAVVGDRELSAAFDFLLHHSSRPYLSMLHDWIYLGLLRDPYGEFFVVDSDPPSSAAAAAVAAPTIVPPAAVAATPSAATNELSEKSWRRYVAAPSTVTVPWFFELADCERVLVTGKYINTVRDSGELDVCELAAPIEYHDHASYYTRIVSRAHAHVSRRVLQTLRQRSSLVDRLNAACHFFLLRRGDAVTRLLALADEELAKRVGAASRVRLASMLGVALRDGADASSSAMRFEDDVSCELLPYNLPQQLLRILHVSASGGVSLMGDALQLEAREAAILGSASKKRAVEHAALQSPDAKALTAERVAFDSDVLQAMSGLTAIEAFSLTFAVPWPASLVLSRDALCKYQLLFRHTFLCKHVERQLAQAWSALNGVARSFRQPREIGAALLRASLVRQRMAHYVHELLYYVTAEVLDPNVRAWQTALAGAETVDDVLRGHHAFLDRCLHQCMLTDRNLVKLVMRMLTTSAVFSDYVCHCAARGAGSVDDALDTFCSGAFEETVKKYANQFDALFRLALEAFAAFSATQSQLVQFLGRLDFNAFYAPNALHDNNTNIGAASSTPY
jgi:gamma-tubulin complex component 2